MSEQNTLPPPGEPQELPIGQILAILWRGRWIIALCVLVAVGMGLGFVIRRGTIWRSSSRLQVESTAGAGATVESLLLAAGGKNYVNTQAEVLRAGVVLNAALQKEALANNPIFDEVENRQIWLKKALKVSVGRKDDIITVSLDSKLKEEACEIINGVVESYLDFYTRRSKSKAEGIVEQLAGKLEKLETESTELLGKKETFLRENPGFSVGGENLVMAHRLRELQTALLQAEDEDEDARIAYEEGIVLAKDPERLREILQLRGSGVGQGNARIKAALRSQIWELQTRRSVLLARVTEAHPSIEALETRIHGLETQIKEIETQNANLVGGYVASLKAAADAASKGLVKIKSKLAEAEEAFNALGLKYLEFQQLEAKWVTNSKLVAALSESVGRFTLADLKGSEDKNPLNINILDMATPRSSTVASSRAMTLAIFLVLGLMAGFGLAWLRGIFDQRLRNVEDVTAGVQIAMLGTLPRVSLSADERDNALRTWEGHESLAEAARSLRTAIYFGLPKGEGRCIQITSPESGDGKSLTASKLGIAMAQAGQRTLIVDADLRRPMQHTLFGIDQVPGLATALASGQRVEELIQRTELDNLDLLTSGPVPANPAEILNSDAFGELLEHLGRQYDRVIVDSTPVLPVADARIIATKCDITVLVLRVDKSTRKRGLAAHESLQTVSARVLGAVLNDMPHGIGYGSYGGRYGYGYGSYTSKKPQKQPVPLARSKASDAS